MMVFGGDMNTFHYGYSFLENALYGMEEIPLYGFQLYFARWSFPSQFAFEAQLLHGIV